MTWKIQGLVPINPIVLAQRDAHLLEFVCVCILTSAAADQHDRDQMVHDVGACDAGGQAPGVKRAAQGRTNTGLETGGP